MKSVNKVILVGNVGQDPETRYLPNGSAVTTLSLATGEEWKDKNTGEKQERTEWHRVVFFGRTAEIAGEYIRKGRKLYVEGKNRTRKWQAQDGSDRWTTEVLADDFLLLGGGEGRQDPVHDDYRASTAEAAARAMAGEARPAAPRPPAGADFEDDIPFMRLQNEYTV